MEIRILKPEEYLEAMLVAHGVFDYCLRSKMGDRGLIEGFNAYANEESMRRLAMAGRITLWGVFDENRMVGMSAMQSEGHITLIYVYSMFQRRGYGTRLLEEMREYAGARLGLKAVTVNALPIWTADFFIRRGFHAQKLAPGTQLPFMPLSARAKGAYQTYEKKPISSKVILGTSLAGLLICIVAAVVFMAIYLL